MVLLAHWALTKTISLKHFFCRIWRIIIQLYTVLLTEDSVNLIVKALKSLSEKKYEPGDRQGRGGLSQGEEVDSLIIDIKNQVFGE